jgi:hypothetical protein
VITNCSLEAHGEQESLTFVLKNSDSSLMLSLLFSTKSISESAGLSPVADCDLNKRRETEPDLFPRCVGIFGEGERPPWLVCALCPLDTDGLQDTMFLWEASFMLFAREDTSETAWSTSIELLEADL